MSFCQQQQCAHCCVEGEVPLLNEDIDRITSMGYFDVYFAVNHQGAKVMRKLEGKCIFFQQGVCEIYERRPKRCHCFPLTYNSERDTAEIEESCRYKEMYEISQTSSQDLVNYIHQLQHEYSVRNNSGNGNGSGKSFHRY
jgi:Fe-S-cluster containining protein